MIRSGGKANAARVSIVSNSLLIAAKLAAGAITGSIAILTEAIHSLVDLVASVVAFVSIRKADEPADEDHPYGHEKVESFASAIEGMLILLGAAIIVFESTRRLAAGSKIDTIGVGLAVMALSTIVNLVVSSYLTRQARRFESPALEGDAAHLRTDAMTSGGVLVGLLAVKLTGVNELDSITAMLVVGLIVITGVRVLRRSSGILVDEVLPKAEMDRIESAIAATRTAEVAGYHKLRARRAGSRRYVDMHVQFVSGTSLERAHELAHKIRNAVVGELPSAEVLIHVEPETSVLDPNQSPGPYRYG